MIKNFFLSLTILFICCPFLLANPQPETSSTHSIPRHQFICETISECIPCTMDDLKHQYCDATKYYHLIMCTKKDDPKEKTKRKESCRPDIIYTPFTVQNLIIFECTIFVLIIVIGVLFYRRTKFLSEQQSERYKRLVQSSTRS